MTWKINSTNPIAFLNSAVRENLGYAWLEPGAVEPFNLDGVLERPIDAFAEQQLTRSLDPADATKRLRVTSHSGAVFHIWKGVHTPGNASESCLMITMDRRLIFAFQTDLSKREDGLVQLGGDKQVILFLPHHFQSQQGKTLKTGEALLGVGLEERAPNGAWEQGELVFDTRESQLESIASEHVTVTVDPNVLPKFTFPLHVPQTSVGPELRGKVGNLLWKLWESRGPKEN